MTAPVWGEALDEICSPETVLVVPTPAGALFTQATAQRWSSEEHLVFACGRYEGIDQRVVDDAARRMRVEEVSIGDYVLPGGESAALVIIEAVVRLLPNVLGNPRRTKMIRIPDCGAAGGPSYTRPPSWRGLDVPEILLSGDHARMDAWRRAGLRPSSDRAHAGPDLTSDPVRSGRRKHRLDCLGDGSRARWRRRRVASSSIAIRSAGRGRSAGRQVHPIVGDAAHPTLLDRNRFGIEAVGDAEPLRVAVDPGRGGPGRSLTMISACSRVASRRTRRAACRSSGLGRMPSSWCSTSARRWAARSNVSPYRRAISAIIVSAATLIPEGLSGTVVRGPQHDVQCSRSAGDSCGPCPRDPGAACRRR